MEIKNIDVLGATGSVGLQALDVAKSMNLSVGAISCGANTEKAEEIIRLFGVKMCAVADESKGKLLKAAVADTECKVYSGENAAADVAAESRSELSVNAITGIAGLMPTVRILESGKELALANKESLVTAGRYVMALAAEKKKEIRPVDSEHCAIRQSLRAGKRSEIKKIILTASGGPFFGYTKEQLAEVTAEQALRHPTWKMGQKITIDSATLMNKGFEIIEACHLFGTDTENTEVIIHRESIIHSMVEYKDNMIMAQLGVPDMRSCIQYAITAPERSEAVSGELDFASVSKMTFFKPDEETFPLLRLAKEAYRRGGSCGAALNGANEAAVSMFLRGKITLPALFEAVEKATLESYTDGWSPDAVFEADRKARAAVLRYTNGG